MTNRSVTLEGNEGVIGFDPFSSIEIRQVIEQALEEFKPVMTGCLSLLQEKVQGAL